jgi:hypothetical protein
MQAGSNRQLSAMACTVVAITPFELTIDVLELRLGFRLIFLNHDCVISEPLLSMPHWPPIVQCKTTRRSNMLHPVRFREEANNGA